MENNTGGTRHKRIGIKGRVYINHQNNPFVPEKKEAKLLRDLTPAITPEISIVHAKAIKSIMSIVSSTRNSKK